MEKGREELSDIKVKSDDLQALRWTNGELVSLIVGGSVILISFSLGASVYVCALASLAPS